MESRYEAPGGKVKASSPGLAMLASFRVQAGVCQAKPLHRMSADNMRVDDLVDIAAGDVPIPVCLGIYDDIRAVLALVEASSLVGAHLTFESALRELLLEKF